MTPQEQQMIDDLVDRIRNTQLNDKDPEAEQRLQQGLAGYPDAVYVLAQTVLVQKYGLEQAQQQMQAMQQQIDMLQQQAQQQQPHKSGSFLGNLLGLNEQPTAQPAAPPPNYGYAQPGYGAPPPYAQPGYGAPSSGGFLRSALQTAAGVAAGEMMFQGMESLFHGFGGGGGYGEDRAGEVINNNYYGDDSGHEHHAEGSTGSGFYNPSNDASRDSDTSDRSQFANDPGYADGSEDSSCSSDDSSPDGDGGSFDDSASGGDDSSF